MDSCNKGNSGINQCKFCYVKTSLRLEKKQRLEDVAIYKENRLVLELKYCHDRTGDPEEKAEEALTAAVDQIIERQYGKEIFGKKLLRMAVVFSESKRQFVRWQKVDCPVLDCCLDLLMA